MKFTPLAALLPLAALVSSPALAHPGDHSSMLSHLAEHLLSEPDHLALLLATGAGALFLARRWYIARRQAQREVRRRDHDA